MAKKRNEIILFDEDETPKNKSFFKKNRYFWVSVLFGIIWLCFVGHYLYVSGWWATRSELAPAELIGGLGGLALPMVLVWLMCAYFDRSEQLEQEAQELKSYLNELVYPTKEGAVYTKTLTDALRTQIAEFKTVFQGVTEQTESVRDDLKHWILDLSTVIEHVDTKTIDSVREIAAHIQNLAEMTTRANQQIEQTAGLFSEQAAVLERVTTGTVRATSNMSQTLSDNVVEIRAIMQEVEETNQKIGNVLIQSGDVMTELDGNTTRIEKAIDMYETSARQQNARLFGNLEKVLSVFRAHGDILEQDVAKTTNRLDVVEDMLKHNADSLKTLTGQAIDQLEKIGGKFGHKAEELDMLFKSFKSDAEQIAQQIKQAGENMTATPIVQTLKANDLLKEASSILNQLQGFSVDMAHLFSPKAEEELWSKYYGGDKTIFMRHIRSELSAGQTKKMLDLYKTDSAFKASVTQYMKSFETLTQSVDKQDDGKLLMGIIIGSDAGRLYMVLADVLKGKKNAN